MPTFRMGAQNKTCHSTFELPAKMNRQLLLVFVAICVLSQNAMALRGALFRSGRSLLHRQINQEVAIEQPQMIQSEKRSPVVELYPVVDTGNGDPEAFASYFRF
ncbi:hypothetical protein GCK72_024966 [Caenorhabditis remanei]|uniref:Uncharacterized protein n=2 Tax=Caenorhabditis remanei TaxID=31234 RepID=E3MVP2_CAERE|nr:hypothetical protein GCK72_024966 [Caenorhabditis remanei]EFP10266.1 hypothetical protein CRE_24075 [Caenorhabditis remanei]KAF1748499.1 hypothetical protein GCK72_024966 [Caenorhabditis remanei]